MGDLKHTQPCSQCPWRRAAAPGWLGADSPEGFLSTTLGEAEMPCHATIDYDDPNWKARLAEAPLCAGALIFLKNTAKSPRNPHLAAAVDAVQEDHDTVFTHGGEFLEHHKSLGIHREAKPGDELPPMAREGGIAPEDVITTGNPEDDENFCFGCRTVSDPTMIRDCCGDPKCGCSGCMCGEEWMYVKA